MKILITALTLLFLLAPQAHAERFIRCKSSRSFTYYCGQMRTGYQSGYLVSHVKNASAELFTCRGIPVTRWLRLRKGLTHVFAFGPCWYWVIRYPR